MGTSDESVHTCGRRETPGLAPDSVLAAPGAEFPYRKQSAVKEPGLWAVSRHLGPVILTLQHEGRVGRPGPREASGYFSAGAV